MEDEKLYDREMIHHVKSNDLIGGSPGTVCVLWKDDMRHIGIARCNLKDQFNRKIGRKIAHGRALHALKEHEGLTKIRKPFNDDVDCLYVSFKHKDGEFVSMDIMCDRKDVDSYDIPPFLLQEQSKEKES